MKTKGLVRKIDNCGRIVFPREMRKMLGLKHGDNVEIFLEGNRVIIKRFEHCCAICSAISGLNDHNGTLLCDNCIEEIKAKW